MKNTKRIASFALLLLLFSCTPPNPREGVWRYDHDRTEDRMRSLFEEQHLKVTEKNLARIMEQFDKHAPVLTLKNGKYVLRGYPKIKGVYSGKFDLKNNVLKAYCDGEDCNWEITYNDFMDEYTVVFLIYPVILTRE